MSDVRMVKLGDLCEHVHKIDPHNTPDMHFKYIDIGSVDNHHKKLKDVSTFTGITAPSRARQVVLPGDIVVSTVRPNLNAIAILPHLEKKYIASTGFSVLRISEQITAKYVFYYLQSKRFIHSMINLATGASYPAVTDKTIKSHLVPIPSLEEQKRIVAILDKAKSIQEARERQLAALDRLKHSLLQETIKSSAIQEIPVGKVISLKSGSFLPAKKQDGGKFPVYGGNGVNGSHSQYMVEEPTIIIGRVGAYCGSVHITRPKSWITDNALIVTIQAEGILQKYLAYVLHSINLNQYANRSGQPSISATRIKDIVIPIIPLTKQENFTKNINNIDRQIYLIRKSLEEDKVLFLSLQSVLFKN